MESIQKATYDDDYWNVTTQNWNPTEEYESQLGWLFPIDGKIKICSKPPTRYLRYREVEHSGTSSVNIGENKKAGKRESMRRTMTRPKQKNIKNATPVDLKSGTSGRHPYSIGQVWPSTTCWKWHILLLFLVCMNFLWTQYTINCCHIPIAPSRKLWLG